MKLFLLPPTLLTLVFLTNSCGTSPKREEPIDIKTFTSSQEEFLPVAIDDSVEYAPTAIPVSSVIPIASPVAGRPGFVFNPYNQNMVDVKGMSAGMKVRDSEDPDPSHIFILP